MLISHPGGFLLKKQKNPGTSTTSDANDDTNEYDTIYSSITTLCCVEIMLVILLTKNGCNRKKD